MVTSSWGCPAPFSGAQRQDKGHKLKHRKFRLNMRKNFFTLRVTEPWNRLPREAVESPSLEIFKTCLEKVLCSLLWVTLLRQGYGLGDPQRSFPTPDILWFCVVWREWGLCFKTRSLSFQDSRRCWNIQSLFVWIILYGKNFTQNLPESVSSKAAPITQKHEVLAGVFWRQQRSSSSFVLYVVISIYPLISYIIQWLSFSSKFSFELISLFIFVCLYCRSLLTAWSELVQGYFRW